VSKNLEEVGFEGAKSSFFKNRDFWRAVMNTEVGLRK
jgi:hypothetical protein